MKPAIFLLAFTYNPTAALPNILDELKTIDNLLSETEGQTRPIWQATQTEIEQNLDKFRPQIRIFHFAGHAGATGLELNRPDQAASISFADGLAGLIAQAPAIKLVFLNGCSTEEQAAALLARGIPAVIATTKPLSDRVAVEFARRFYQNFTRRNSTSSLQQAFDAAFNSFSAENGKFNLDMLDEQVRGNYKRKIEDNEALYELHIHPEKRTMANEKFADWIKLEAPPDPFFETPKPQNTAAKKDIEKLIAAGWLDEALQKLAILQPDAVALQQQFASTSRENRMGMLSSDEWFRARARITAAALEFLNEI